MKIASGFLDTDDDQRDGWCSQFYARRRWTERIAEATR